jgi:SAM-dependent methyltransferase
MTDQLDLDALYGERFDRREAAAKARVWDTLCRHFFQRYVRGDDAVVDLGAGMCEFINTIRCGRKIAVDPSPAVRRFAGPDVEVLQTVSTDLGALADGSVDVVFASNFFEHLPDTDAFLTTLREARRVLRPGGSILILQPNIAAVGGRFWDFLDHSLPLTERTVTEALAVTGFEIREVRARFLPYTTKSRLPKHPLLVRLYLAIRPAHRLLGGQAWIVGRRP